jgi:hypothetical protein
VMMMVKAVQIFLKSVKERAHVIKLFEKLDMLSLKLVCDRQNTLIAFHNGDVLLLDDYDERETTCVIKGQHEAIDSLFEGKDKLRNLIRNGQLKVEASFRTILLLESIFYLTKPEEL